MYRFLVIFVAITLTIAPAFSQVDNDGSIYSSYILGDRAQFGNSRAAALGITGLALPSFTYVSLNNPATLGNQFLSRFVAGFSIDAIESSIASGEKSTLTDASLSTLQFSFPIIPLKLGVGIGLQPYTRVGYKVQSILTLPAESANGLPAIEYVSILAGNGGLQKATLGSGYNFGNGLSVGASLNFIFGEIEHIEDYVFPVSNNFLPASITTSTTMSGLSGNFGITYRLDSLASTSQRLVIGASFTLPTNLTGTRVEESGLSSNPDTLFTPQDVSVTTPLEVGLGVSWSPNPKWTVGTELLYEKWSGFESNVAWKGYQNASSNTLSDRLKVGGGFEFIPAGGTFTQNYLARIAYRVGFYVDQTYFMVTADDAQSSTKLNSIALTAGLGLPTVLSGSADLNFEIGQRGTTDFGLVQDLYYKASLVINFGERWFFQRKLR